MTPVTYSAFEGSKLLIQGSLGQVVLKVKRKLDKSGSFSVLIFNDLTGKEMDFNLRGTEDEVLKRLEVYLPLSKASVSETQRSGRPKLGVVSREISLLPRQWEWLAAQPGGASSTLRKLVDEAKRNSQGESLVKQAQERTYKFMSVLAGNEEGYEEALRALYRRDKKAFQLKTRSWPTDVRQHAMNLAKPAFAETQK